MGGLKKNKRAGAWAGSSDIARFTLPVIAENVFTTSIGLAFSSILGKISPSSLSAAGVGNQVISLLSTLLVVVVTGSSILVALATGQGDRRRASEIAEQSVLAVPVISITLTAVCYALSAPVIRLLMPGAEEAFYQEGLSYYRMILLSLPGVLAMNTFSGLLRASGESRAPLICTVIVNLVQLASAYLFVNVFHMELAGAGLAQVVCRYTGAVALGAALFFFNGRLHLNFRRVLHFQPAVMKEIFRVGAPNIADAAAVQCGYVIINSMLIHLGDNTFGVYQVIASLISFSGIAQSIVSVSSTTILGHLIGAGDMSRARSMQKRIMLIGVLSGLALSGVLMTAPSRFAALFTGDEGILADSAKVMWLTLVFTVPGITVNAAEPAARVGGFGKKLVISCSLCIWLIRLPLTWLLCSRLRMGVVGAYLANTVSCYARTFIALLMIRSAEWGRKAV